MPDSSQGTFLCPCGCGARIILTTKAGADTVAGFRVVDIRSIIDNYYQEEESPPRDLRPDGLSEGVHAPQGGSGEEA